MPDGFGSCSVEQLPNIFIHCMQKTQALTNPSKDITDMRSPLEVKIKVKTQVLVYCFLHSTLSFVIRTAL